MNKIVVKVILIFESHKRSPKHIPSNTMDIIKFKVTE